MPAAILFPLFAFACLVSVKIYLPIIYTILLQKVYHKARRNTRDYDKKIVQTKKRYNKLYRFFYRTFNSLITQKLFFYQAQNVYIVVLGNNACAYV